MKHEMTKQQRDLLAYLRKNPGATIREIAAKMDRSKTSAAWHVRRLTEMGLLTRRTARSEWVVTDAGVRPQLGTAGG